MVEVCIEVNGTRYDLNHVGRLVPPTEVID